MYLQNGTYNVWGRRNHHDIFLPWDPQIISHLDALCRTYLVFPLRWHDLSISATNIYTSIETGLVMCFHNLERSGQWLLPPPPQVTHLPTIHPISTNTTVVRTLGTRETSLWPSKWVAIQIQQSVFLFNAKPGVCVLNPRHNLENKTRFIFKQTKEKNIILTSAQELLWLVGWGFPSLSCVSHMTRQLPPGIMGSG